MHLNLLCADIGGTNSRFAHFILEDEKLSLCTKYICPTSALHSTGDLLGASACTGLFLKDAHFVCFGLAGLIDDDKLGGRLTNGDLILDFRNYKWVNPNINFILVNDFALQAYGTLIDDFNTLSILPQENPLSNTEKNTVNEVRTVLGAGTGLGTAVIVPVADKWQILPTEAGHTDFPFYGEQENNFAEFAKKALKQERLSAEDILSAQGLSLLHYYVHGQQLLPSEAATLLWENGQETTQLGLYARFLGRFCRHWALNTLCRGGLYLGGGVLVKNPLILQSQEFKREFYHAPSAMCPILDNIPIKLMLEKEVGLWGAAYLAKMLLQDDSIF